jgi:sRNA-binding protein
MAFKPGNTEKKKASASKEKAVETTAPEAVKTPVQKAFAVERQSNGKWILHIYDIQDGQILGVKSGEAEPKALAVERFKIQFVQHYILGKN